MKDKFILLFGLWICILIIGCGGGEDKLLPPKSPSGLQATAVSDSEINMTWTSNSDNEDGFKIERKIGDLNHEEVYNQVTTVGKGVISYSDTGLNCETIYYYRIKSSNSAGDSDYSNDSYAMTLTCPIIIPYSPSNPSASVISLSQINISWTDNSDNEIGFNIERRIGTGGTYINVGTLSANITNYEDNDVLCETTYYYRIDAFNDAGESLFSNVINATTGSCPPTAPSSPSNLQAYAISFSEIDLSWTDNSDDEDGFKIERRELGGIYSQIDFIAANKISYQNTNLNCAKTYNYRVRAYNSIGDSTYSAEVTATTNACIPKVELYGSIYIDEDIFSKEATLLGEVINTGAIPVCRINISIDLIASNQTVLGSLNRYITGNTLVQNGSYYGDCLRPGEKVSFKISTTILAAEINHYNYSISWDSNDTEEPKLILTIKDNLNTEQDSYYDAIYLGEIENTGTISACSLKVTFVLKDLMGDPNIFSSDINGSTLIINSGYNDACIRPGEVRSFKVITDESIFTIHEYSYKLNWDEKNISESNVSLNILNISMTEDTNHYALFTGQVKNVGSIDAKSVKINVTMKKLNNKVNGTNSGNLSIGTLSPGQSGNFTVYTSTLYVNINSNYPVINFRE